MLEPRLCLKMLHLLKRRWEHDRRRFAKCVCCPLRSSVRVSFFYSLSYRNRLRKRKSDYVILDSHSFEPASSCCIKFILNESADTSLATTRTTVDQAIRGKIVARLAARPNEQAVAVCRICKGLMGKTPRRVRENLHVMRLPETPEGIVWHFRSW